MLRLNVAKGGTAVFILMNPTGWNGTSGERGGELDPLSGGAKMSVLCWPSINWQDRDVTVRTAWMACWPLQYKLLGPCVFYARVVLYSLAYTR